MVETLVDQKRNTPQEITRRMGKLEKTLAQVHNTFSEEDMAEIFGYEPNIDGMRDRVYEFLSGKGIVLQPYTEESTWLRFVEAASQEQFGDFDLPDPANSDWGKKKTMEEELSGEERQSDRDFAERTLRLSSKLIRLTYNEQDPELLLGATLDLFARVSPENNTGVLQYMNQLSYALSSKLEDPEGLEVGEELRKDLSFMGALYDVAIEVANEGPRPKRAENRAYVQEQFQELLETYFKTLTKRVGEAQTYQMSVSSVNDELTKLLGTFRIFAEAPLTNGVGNRISASELDAYSAGTVEDFERDHGPVVRVQYTTVGEDRRKLNVLVGNSDQTKRIAFEVPTTGTREQEIFLTQLTEQAIRRGVGDFKAQNGSSLTAFKQGYWVKK